MPSPADVPAVRCTGAALASLEADLICAPIFEDEDAQDLGDLDDAVGQSVARARASREITGKVHELFFGDVTDSTWQTRRVLLVGAGPRARYDTVRARTVAGTAAMAARDRRVRRLAFVCRGPGGTPAMAQAAAEGIIIGAFRDSRFKTDEDGSEPLTAIDLVASDGATAEMTTAVERGAVLASCSNLARELSNEPGNLFTPRVFADRALELATGPRISVEVLDEAAIASQGMGLLEGVARGSVEPPRVIVMRYEPENAGPGPVLGLVGKGVTFDTGGISIKPAEGM